MSELIPLLWDLATEAPRNGSRRGFASVTPVSGPPVSGWPGVPSEFVPAFVEIHHGKPTVIRDDGWRTAQAHWEVVVARVLETDIVKPNVSGELAIRRAVRASALLLNKMARHGRCPICPQHAMVSSR